MNGSLTQLGYVKDESIFIVNFSVFFNFRFKEEKLWLSYVPAVAVKHTEQTLFDFIGRKDFGCGLFDVCLNSYSF